MDSADFIRVIEAPDPGSTLFKLTEFYKDGGVKSAGHLLSHEPSLILDGKFLQYSPEGKLIYKCFFNKGYYVGYASTYYPNGKLKKVEFFPDSLKRFYDLASNRSSYGLTKNGRRDDDKIEVVSFFDVNGNQTITEGNGEMVDYDGEYTLSYYRNKLKNGICKGSYEGQSYEDIFVNGKFISGTTILKTGSKIYYNTVYVPATYPKGRTVFTDEIQKAFVRPKKKMRAGGYTSIKFMIDKDGQVKTLPWAESVDAEIRQAFENAFRNAGFWYPATYHGIAVSSFDGILIELL